MNKFFVALVILAISGCSSAPKTSKTASTTSTNPFMSSSKKLQQDVTQTQADLSSVESSVKFPK